MDPITPNLSNTPPLVDVIFPEPPPSREDIIEILSHHSGFAPELFQTISDHHLMLFHSIVLQLKSGTKNKEDILFALDENKNYARFSRKVFRLPHTLALHYSVVMGQLRVIEHLHSEDNPILAVGSYKVAKKTNSGIVRSVFKDVIAVGLQLQCASRSQRVTELLITKFTKEQREFFLIPEVVVTMSRKRGKRKYTILTTEMNKQDLFAIGFKIPISQVLRISMDMTTSLQLLHEHNLAHLDATNANFFMEIQDNGQYRVKLGDFDLMLDCTKQGRKGNSVQETFLDSPPELQNPSSIIKGNDLKSCDVFFLGSQFNHIWKVSGMENARVQALIAQMRESDPKKRPSTPEVAEVFKSISDEEGKQAEEEPWVDPVVDLSNIDWHTVKIPNSNKRQKAGGT